jgi:hypothetical protein
MLRFFGDTILDGRSIMHFVNNVMKSITWEIDFGRSFGILCLRLVIHQLFYCECQHVQCAKNMNSEWLEKMVTEKLDGRKMYICCLVNQIANKNGL